MSGCSMETVCSACGGTAFRYEDWRPCDWEEVICYVCGFAHSDHPENPFVRFFDPEELEDFRNDYLDEDQLEELSEEFADRWVTVSNVHDRRQAMLSEFIRSTNPEIPIT